MREIEITYAWVGAQEGFLRPGIAVPRVGESVRLLNLNGEHVHSGSVLAVIWSVTVAKTTAFVMLGDNKE